MNQAFSGRASADSEETVAAVLARTSVARSWLADASTVGSVLADTRRPIRFRVTGHPPETASIVTDILRPAFRILETLSAGAIQVVDTWGAKVHGDREGAAALRGDLTDMALCYSPWDPDGFPMLQALCLPGMFPSAELGTFVAESLYADFFREDVERQGLRMGRLKVTGPYSLFSVRPIRNLKDLDGLRIGCSYGPEAEIFTMLDAEPVPMSSLEIAAALRKGRVDAISIADASAEVFQIHECARFRTTLDLTRLNMEFFLRKEFWTALPLDLQLLLSDWLRAEAQAECQIFYGLGGALARERFRAAGMTFIRLEDDDRKRCLQAVQPLTQRFIEKSERVGRPGGLLVSRMRSMVEEYGHLSANQLMEMALTRPLRRINQCEERT
ncbi:TRAP transporter substrate-binding protein DctP [Paraburkholderia xenovorans]|uniref:TRAP transporter substrate-binding protein n=1 Tax=Paraburkholderia xenovorans TaxID=36873 RepID=UPI0038B9A097